MVLDERAVAKLDRRSGGDVVEAVVRYPGSPSRRGGDLRPVRSTRQEKPRRK